MIASNATSSARTNLDRRTFVSGAAAAAAGILGAAVAQSARPAPALADEPATDTPAAQANTVAATAGDWLGEAPAITDADCVETIGCDVLVAGAGCAGYFAASHAAEAGAKVLLIEKCVVGCGIRDSALGAVDSRLQQEAGVAIDKAEILNDLYRYADGQANPALHRIWADHSGEAVDWYCDLVSADPQITVDLEWNMPQEQTRYHMWPTGHGTNDGTALVGGVQTAVVPKVMALLDANIEAHGGEVRYLTALVELIQDETGRVIGAYATNGNDEYIRIDAAKGVVVATGGYVNNDQMYTALQGELKKSVSGWCCHPTKPATGDGIKAALWAGAKLDTVATSMIFDRGLVAPETEIAGPESGGYYFTLGSQPFLKVNKAGKRFCNESSPYDYVIHAANRFAGHAYYMIWDANWQEDVLRFHTIGCSTIDLHEGGDQQAMGLEATAEEMEQLVADGLLVKADTIEELAERMGLDTASLVQTVERQNANFDAGRDDDFGKEPFRLSEIRTAPFYAAKLGGLALCTLHGITIDEQFRALDANNEPIPGLYMLGNDSGSYYASTYPNFGAGTNAGRCVTHGMVCGRAIADA